MIAFFLTSGLFLGWSLGANDAANIFGSAVGSRMVSFKKAAITASVFVILGAVLQGSGAAHTLGKLGAVNALAGSFTVALAAAVTVFWMTKLSIPVSTTQAIVGAIIGWNFFTGNPTDIDSLTKIVSTWFFGPLLGAIFAILLYLLLRGVIRKSKIHLLKLDAYLRTGLIIVGAFGAYSLGANNIANVMGVFVSSVQLPDLNLGIFSLTASQQLFSIGGLAIAAGIMTYSKRVMETVGNSLMELNAEAALIVVLAHSLVLFIFSSQSLSNFFVTLGLPAIPMVPVSSSQVIVGSILGIALLKKGSHIKTKVLFGIVSGWVTTPIISGVLTFIALFFVQNVFQLKVVHNVESQVENSTINQPNQIQEITTMVGDNIANSSSSNLLLTVFISLFILFMATTIFLGLKIRKNKKSHNNSSAINLSAKQLFYKQKLESAKQKNSELRKKIEYKDSEITNLALSIIQQNNFMINLKDEINNLKKQVSNKNNISLNDLNKLIIQINQIANINQEREKIQILIENSNKDFYLLLNEKFPTLTNNEKRLSALLRLNFSSKEISAILNISVTSVEMNRYRLRKKMQISPKQSLTDFVKKI